MTDEEIVKNGSGDNVSENEDAPIVEISRQRSRTALWITTPLIIIVLSILAFTGYLFSSGIDISYAVGTSGWAAPPGTRLAGQDIGGKSFNEVEGLLEQMNSEFSGLSVWVVEASHLPSIYEGDFSFSSTPDQFALSAVPSEFGLSLDLTSMERELDSLNEKSNDIMLIQHRLALWKTPPEINVRLSLNNDVAEEFLEGVKSTVETEPVDALMDLANYRITPSVDGIVVDVELTLAGIPTIFPSLMDIPVELKMERSEPDVTEEDFAHIDAENPLATYTTNFSRWKRNRSFNIELGASHFEGLVIQPGETISFDEITGTRNYSDGYLAAPMYLNHRPEMQPAGGMCQVSTTLYNALLLAGFDIVFRLPHSRPCSYVPYGRDATVAYRSVDLKMRSTLVHPVFIHQIVDRHDAGTITFDVFGHPDDRVYIELGNAYSWIGRSESMTTYEIDLSLDPCEEVVVDSGVSGLHQRVWRIWYDEAGVEIRREDLTNDHVRPVGAFIRHNPCDDGPYWVTDEPDYKPPVDDSSDTPPPDDPGIYF